MDVPRHQFQQEMDSDALFISFTESTAPQYAPSKLCSPQHPGLYAPQSSTPPQLVPDTAAWSPPQPCPQVWPTNQGQQGGAAGQEEALLGITLSLEDFQGLQVCHGDPELLHEEQGVLPHVLQGVPQGLQESQGVPYFQQVCQQVPQGPHGTPQEGRGKPQELQHSPASQEGSPEGVAGPRRARRASRPRRSKLYERAEPFEDPLQEKRRRDAINSKKNREASKAKMTDLRRRVDAAAALRDNLKREVTALRQREAQLLGQLAGQQVPAAAPVTTLTAPRSTATPPGQGRRPLAATLLAGTPQGAATLPPAASLLTGTPQGAATLPPAASLLTGTPQGAATLPPAASLLTGTPQGAATLPPAASLLTGTPQGAATLPPAASLLTGTPQGAAFLPPTTTTAAAATSLPCPKPHLTLATPYLPPTPPSSCMQADALLTPTTSPGPYFSPFNPPTPHSPH